MRRPCSWRACEQTHVALVEGMLSQAREADHAEHPVGGEDRHAKPRLGVETGPDRSTGRRIVVRGRRSAAARVLMTMDVRPSPNCIGGELVALAFLDREREVDPAGRRVVQRDRRSRRIVEDLVHPLADELDDRLEVELLGQGRRRSR